MQRAIWVVSEDKNLLAWLGRTFRGQAPIINIASKPAPHKSLPLLVILGCDYNCQLESCTKIFCLAEPWLNVPVKTARPFLLRKGYPRYPEFILPHFSFLDSLFTEHRGIETHDPGLAEIACGLNFHRVGTILPILRVQEYVLNRAGKVYRTAQLKGVVELSLSALSKSFKRMSGITLKQFINKIRLCYCLRNLIWTSKPIKCIALEFGYKPTSFSLKFRKTYGAWPSEVRNAKKDVLRALTMLNRRVKDEK